MNCEYCLELVEEERVLIGLSTCFECAKNVSKVRHPFSDLNKLGRVRVSNIEKQSIKSLDTVQTESDEW